MTPKSFDSETSREVVGDAKARSIEEKARKDADLGVDGYAPPNGVATSWWGDRQIEFERSIYLAQFKKRIERNQRKSVA